MLVAARDLRLGGGLEGEGGVLAAVDIGRGFPLETAGVIQAGHVDGELVADGDVAVEAGPVGAEAAAARLDLGVLLADDGLGRGLVHDAGGAACAEEQGVRAAADFHRVGVVRVEEQAGDGRVIVFRRVRRAEAAHAVRRGDALRATVDVVAPAADAVAEDAAADGGGRVAGRTLDVGLIPEHVVDVHRARVGHLLLGDDGDRGRQVGEVRVQPAARQGVSREVAGILLGRDDEGGQDDLVVLLIRRFHRDFLGRVGGGGVGIVVFGLRPGGRGQRQGTGERQQKPARGVAGCLVHGHV